MTLAQALRQGRETLAASSIDEPHIVAELLLMHCLGIDRAKLYTDAGLPLTPTQEKQYNYLIERGRKGEPAAYITGRREFYGLDFYVDRRVLIPRPESELMVETAITMARDGEVYIADIGTGSGAVAISLAKNLPRAIIYAVDISAAALRVARRNCQKYRVEARVKLLRGDLLEPLTQPVDIIVANLPYVSRAALAAARSLDHEPRLALDGGADGLDAIRRLSRQVKSKLFTGGRLLLEIGAGQEGAVRQLLKEVFPWSDIEVKSDLSGTPRLIALAPGET